MPLRVSFRSLTALSWSSTWKLSSGNEPLNDMFVQEGGLFSLNTKGNPLGISRDEKYFFDRAVRK